MENRRRLSPSARPLLAAAALVFALTAPARAQVPAPPDTSRPSAVPGLRHASVVLQPGDKVRLRVWREPDLSGDFAVDENGVAVFPHVGRLEVGRISTDSLQGLLISRYAGSLRDPAVEVTVLRRVSVLGSVRNPGLFYVDPTITVADVLALAGGVSPEGNQKRIDLVRGGERLQVHLTQASSLADSFIQPGDQLWVPERSWVSRNTWVLSAGITGVALVIAALLRY